MADETVIISNLPTHTPAGSDYLAIENSTETGKNTVNNIVAAAQAVQTNTQAIGTLSSLTTDAKDSLVAAVNEVDSHTDTNTAAISQLNSNLANLIGYKTVEVGTVTILPGGYLSISDHRPATPTGYRFMFALLNSYTSETAHAAFTVTDEGTWLIGTGGDTITGLRVDYFYIKTGRFGPLT